jgi:hypothetical protein
MSDRENEHASTRLIDLVDHAVVAAMGAVFALQIEPQWPPYAMWALRQRTVDELDRRGRDPLGKAG